MECCEPSRLCDLCFGTELTRLIRCAEGRGKELADVLAAALVPEPVWVKRLDGRHRAVRARVQDLARDPRLIDELAQLCAAAAVRRLEAVIR